MENIRQDGNMKADNHWYAYTYDDYGHVLTEGWAADSLSTPTDTLIQNTWGTTGAEKGKLKTEAIKLLNDPNNLTLHKEHNYDDCGRPIVTKYNSILHPTPGSIVDSLILDSRAMAIESYQKIIPDSLTIKHRYTYDHAGREKKSYIQITTPEQTWPEQELCEKSYTVKEQISALKLGGTLQEVNYGYLPNRLLKSINTSFSSFWTDINNTDLFGMDFQYDLDNVDSNINNDILQKNGNISGIQWTTRNPDGSTFKKQSFGLKYHWLNMLSDATYSYFYDNSGAYNVNVVYDNLRGSFNNIQRKSQGTQIDNMSYSYVGGTNKIDKITDSATGNVSKGYKAKSNDSYVYDPNGSIIYDPSRKTSLIRNHLLLVERVEIPDSNSMIMFYYDAVGMLQRQESIEDSTIVIIKDYIGSIEYINGSPHIIQHENGYILLDRGLSEEHLLLIGVESGDSTYESISTISKRTINNPDSIEYRAEEFIVLTNGFEVNLGADFAALIDTFPIMNLDYRYHIYDHLGNMRVEFKDNGMGKAVTTSQHHYYPFGAEMEGSWQQTNDVSQQSYMRLGGNRITYFDMDLDLHAFRDYDPWTGRWHGPDMLSDWAPEWSPYRYGFNNPVNTIDPFGLFESRAAARQYARDNDISIGWFSRSKIREQADGSYAIENKKDKTSIANDSEFGVMTGVLITSGAPSQAFTNSIYVNGALGGGMGFELGYAQDNYSQSGFYFRMSGELGLGGGAGFSHQTLTALNGSISLDNIAGNDLEYNLGIGPIGITWGGDQSVQRPSRFDILTKYGENYLIDGIGLDPEDILRSNWKFKPKMSFGGTVSFGKTWFLTKEKN